MSRASLALGAAVALAACGVKAPPRPPERSAPGAVPAGGAAAPAPAPATCAGCAPGEAGR